MTAAEFQNASSLPEHPAWMGCHFSSYGNGLSNVPHRLPVGAMLMLNDRIPINGHDPIVVAKTLCETAEALKCDSILLDLQRADYDEQLAVVRAVLDLATCPVGISAAYGKDFDCPVLVPPIAPHIQPEDALAPWSGREIWLELSTEGTQIEVTEEGSHYTPLPHFSPAPQAHFEDELHCHYVITVEPDRILFQLGRGSEDQKTLLAATEPFGVTRAIGLWQELNDQGSSA